MPSGARSHRPQPHIGTSGVPDGSADLQREALLTARARRRLIEHALVERRTLLALTVVLAIVAVICAIGSLTAASVVAGLASGSSGLLLKARADGSPSDDR